MNPAGASAQDFKCCLLIRTGCISSQIMPMQKHEDALCVGLRDVHDYSSLFSGNQGGVGETVGHRSGLLLS